MDPHRLGSYHAEMVRMAGIHEEKREKENMEEMHQGKVEKIIKSAERSVAGDPRGFQKVGAKCENFKERVEVAKRHSRAPSQ